MSTHTVPRLTLPVERFQLANGATLLVSRRPGAPVFAVHAHIRGGPANDPVGKEGSAWLTGALSDQGTRQHSESEIAAELEPAGGEISGDATGLSGSIVNGDWELLIELLTDQLLSPVFPEDKVARQRTRLLDRLEVEKDDPRHRGGQLFRKLVYGDHWLGRAAYGSIESVKAISSADLRAFHARNWVAKRAVIGVCGDVDSKVIKRALEKRLARWKSGSALSPTPPQFPDRAPRSGVFHATRAQVHVFLGHLGVRRADPDYPALVVMDHVLGTGPGFTNRISRRLRDELGLAYTVHAAIHSSAGLLPGMFTAYIGTSPQHLRTAIEGFQAEIRRLQDEPITQAELEIAVGYLVGSFPLGFERASRRASYMVAAELHQLPSDNLERLLGQFAAVTREDVQRVARTHLFPDASCLAVAGPVRAKDLASFYPSAKAAHTA